MNSECHAADPKVLLTAIDIEAAVSMIVSGASPRDLLEAKAWLARSELARSEAESVDCTPRRKVRKLAAALERPEAP